MSKIRKRHRHQQLEPAIATIESLSQDGRGVAHIDGKATFIHGALPGEQVRFVYEKVQRRYDEGRVEAILTASPERVLPGCQHFGLCGGCGLQHLAATAQINAKEQVLRDALQHVGGVTPEQYLPPLVAEHWGYRRKARIGVKYVARKERLLIGFRERSSSLVADLQSCEVLHPQFGQHLTDLNSLISALSISKQIPQIEMAMGDETCALVLRILTPPDIADQEKLRQFGEQYNFDIYLQTGGPEQIKPLANPQELYYSIPELNLKLYFEPLDFTQINLELNRLLVMRVLELLEPKPHEKILDLFCGIGNFSLPLATKAGLVIGVEAATGLVARATKNANINGLDNCQFFSADLYNSLVSQDTPWLQMKFDQVVLDPPRSGAVQVLPLLPKLGARRVLYISCFPATLARDAKILVQDLGYKLRCAGVMDMFPHTAHVESIALFERK